MKNMETFCVTVNDTLLRCDTVSMGN